MLGGMSFAFWTAYGFFSVPTYKFAALSDAVIVHCAFVGGSLPWLTSLFYFSSRFDWLACRQRLRLQLELQERENKETERRKDQALREKAKADKEAFEKNEYFNLKKRVKFRQDNLLDLRLFNLIEQMVGSVQWSKLKYLPRYVCRIDTPLELLPIKLTLSQRFALKTPSPAYSSDDVAHDVRMIYSPTLPLFIPIVDPIFYPRVDLSFRPKAIMSVGTVEKLMNSQIDELLFVANVLRIAAVAIKQPDILGPSEFSQAEVCDVCRSLFEMVRKVADNFLKEVADRLKFIEQFSDKWLLAKSIARRTIMDGVHHLVVRYGEFLPHEQLIRRIDNWLESTSGTEIDPQPCVDELEREAIVFHASCVLDELEQATPGTLYAILRERVSASSPVAELRQVFAEIQRLRGGTPETKSRAKSLARWTIMDGLQELLDRHGEFLSNEQSVSYIDSWLMRNTSSEIDPQPCLEELERMAIIFHASHALDELEKATTVTSSSILRERISGNRPVAELRQVFAEIQRMLEAQSVPAMPDAGGIEEEEEEHKLKDWLDQFNRNCDETITDELQRELAKEKFQNSQFMPAMQELAKRRAGL